MKHPLISAGVLLLLSLSFLLPFAGAAIISSSTTLPTSSVTTSTLTTKTNSTTTDQCLKSLCGTLNPKNQTFDPSKQPNYFGTDLGKFSTQTDPDGFVWSTGSNDFLIMGLPTVGSTSFVGNRVLYFNSSHTAYKFSGAFGSLNVFFKPAQYKVKISIEANLASPQSVCLPFTSGNPIVQQSGIPAPNTIGNVVFQPVIRAGTELFSWADISNLLSPTWSSVTNSLCLSLPIGITNIDPIALDGSGKGATAAATSQTCAFTTTTSNDILILIAIVFNANVSGSVTDNNAHTFTQRLSLRVGNSPIANSFYEYYSTWTGSGTDTITFTAGASTFISLICYGVSGGNISTPFDPNVALPATANSGNPVSITTSNANDVLIVSAGDYNGGGSTPATDGTWTVIQDINNVAFIDMASEYKVVAATQSGLSVQFRSNMYGGANHGVFADAIQQAAAANQPVVLVLKVNPSPSPQGGDIVASCIAVVFTCNVVLSTTTISTSLAWTVSTSSTITIMANEFSAYIQNGWSGDVTLISDTVNPTQIVSITSFTTTTQSSTLTANFVTPGAASSGNFFAVMVLGAIVVGFMLIALIASRRR